jgi:hypothetical protein
LFPIILEAFSRGFFIFMQPHLEFQQEMCPMSLHFYLGIFQNVITTTTYIFVAHKALAKKSPSKYPQILGNLRSMLLVIK